MGKRKKKRKKSLQRQKQRKIQMQNTKKQEKPKEQTRKNHKSITYIILAILLCIFIFSGYKLAIWIKSDHETKKTEQEFYSSVVKIEKTEQENGKEDEEISIDFEKLEQTNQDVIGWIRIENTYINYPILQGKTEEYYMERDINKKYNLSGSIFIVPSSKKDFTDDNTIIYGHNMKNQRMFANLNKIYKGELGNEIYVEIYTKAEKSKYKVFSAYMTQPVASIIQKNFKENQKEKYIQNAINKSSQKFECEINNEKNIITLITCNGIGDKRIIVNAIKQ